MQRHMKFCSVVFDIIASLIWLKPTKINRKVHKKPASSRSQTAKQWSHDTVITSLLDNGDHTAPTIASLCPCSVTIGVWNGAWGYENYFNLTLPTSFLVPLDLNRMRCHFAQPCAWMHSAISAPPANDYRHCWFYANGEMIFIKKTEQHLRPTEWFTMDRLIYIDHMSLKQMPISFFNINQCIQCDG